MMKKVLFFAGLAAAVLSLVGCNKEADFFGRNGRKMQIVLSDVDTRTVNDGLSTKWVDGDALNVFYAPTGTTTYSENTKFEVDDAASNHATGTAELTADAYDWYLLYPYDEHIKTPASTNSGYVTIGSRSDKTQTQTGLDSKAHLAGVNMPVYGVAKNVSIKATPEVAMKQVTSVVAINLTNATDQPLKVDAVSFTAPEAIVGTFYLDFTGEALAFVGSGANYVSQTATLDVTGDETISAGASAKFYIAVKPFAAKAGDELAVKVHVGDLIFEKTLSLPSAVEFKSGIIKQLNISYTGGSALQPSSLEEIAAMDKDTDILTNEVLVVGKYARGVMLAQNNFYLLAFDNAGVNAAIGDIVTVTGKVGEYAGLKQIASPEVTVISSDNEVVLPDPKVLEGLDEYESDKIELIQYSGTLAVSGNYFNVNVDGSTRQGSIQYPLDTDAMKALDKKPITATGFFIGITGSGKYVNMMSTSVVEKEGNVFDVTPTQINVAATATSAEINVTGNVAWTAEASDGATVSPTSGTGAGTVTVTFPANTDANNTKEYTVFVRTDAEGVNDEFEVNITQGKAVSGNYFVKVTAAADLTDGLYLIVNEKASVALKDAVDEASNGLAVTIASDMVEATNAVKAVAFTFTASNGAFQGANGKYLAHSGTKNTINPTDTPSANTVTFSDGNAVITAEDEYFIQYNKSSGQERFRYYKSAQTDGEVQLYKLSDGVTPPPAATLESIAVSGQKTVFTVGDTFAFDGKVTATYSDNTTKDVTASATVSTPDLSTAGTKEVTVSYTEGNVTKEANYNITVNAAVVDGKTVSMTMTEYVAANGCKISSGSDATMYKTLQLNESVRMSTTGDDNCGSFWGNDTQEWRLYQNKKGNVIVSVAEGCELKSVKLTFSATNGGVLKDAGGATVASGDKKTVSGTSVTYTVENSGTATNGQIRITAVEVVYTGDGTTFPDTPPTVITTTISMPGSQAVYIGESFSLNATSNVQGASISYESEDSSIASVNASGVVTGVAEGVVKVYARITGVEGEYTDAERYCIVTVAKKPDVVSGTWEAKALSSIADGTQFILVSTNGDGESFAMGNDNGASMAPKAISVTVNDGTLTNPASNVIFVLNKTADGYVFKMEGGETWVYCYNNNNGIRVGTTETNVFTVDSESGYLVINDGTQNRYVGVYNKQDWRAYTSVHNNIKGQTFTFFVKK